MKVKTEEHTTVATGGGDGGESEMEVGGGVQVVVGVKFDAPSRELLTWSLMKMAQPGDRVIALHVLDGLTDETVGGTASLLSLVKTFDSLLTVYEGFCNLKQVDLKLKVCRGGSSSAVRKILVREAKVSGASKVILGTSKTRLAIRSSASTAKYCARKLSKCCSVFAVTSGKIVFQRDANLSYADDDLQEKSDQESQSCRRLSQNNESSTVNSALDLVLPLPHTSNNIQGLGGFCGNGTCHNSSALVPFKRNEVVSNSGLKDGLSLLRRVFFLKRHPKEHCHVKKTSIIKWVFKLPSRASASVVHPDRKDNSISSVDEDRCTSLEGEGGAIVPIGPEVEWCPVSPFHGSNDVPEELNGLHEKYSSSCRLFTYEELLFATSNFMPENLVGRGGSSYVYKGCLPDGKELAVKMLKPSKDVLNQFVREIEILTTLHHKNIISVFGFCFERNNLLLVYDLLSRGSLDQNLHGHKKEKNSFGWQERYKVAVGIAEALDYLHNHSDQPVIHRDVKSSNVLLSDDFEPQLSDFGLASWVSSSSQVTWTDVAGTFGYLAPEYFMHGKVSDKVDVFAFGVVLLELLSGRMPISSGNAGQESLVMWAKPILDSGKYSQLLDPQLGTSFDNRVEQMVLAAILCVRYSPRSRPQMSVVLKLLQGDSEVTNWARQQVSASEVNALDGEAFPSNIRSLLNVALLDLEDDSLSISSTDQGVSLEDYLQKRCCPISSFA